MATTQEKKWFIYLVDHHEGPFTVDEVLSRVSQGSASSQQYVWCEGMADWVMMNEVDAFRSAMSGLRTGGAPDIAPIGGLEKTQTLDASEGMALDDAPALEVPADDPVPAVVDDNQGRNPLVVDVQEVDSQTINSSSVAVKSGFRPLRSVFPTDEDLHLRMVRRKQRRRRVLRILFLCGVFCTVYFYQTGPLKPYIDPVLQHPQVQSSWQSAKQLATPYVEKGIEAARPWLNRVGEKIPWVANLVSPVAKIEDLSGEGKEAIRKAAVAPVTPGTYSLEVAQATGDPVSPVFYLGSSLPEGTKFEFWVWGVPDTLLNYYQVLEKREVVLVGHIGKTRPFRLKDRDPMPKGKYHVVVFDARNQLETVQQALANVPVAAVPSIPGAPAELATALAGKKVVFHRALSLGGELDHNYDVRLKKYHDELLKKSKGELTELRMLYLTFNGLLKDTNRLFQSFSRLRPGSPAPAKWVQSHNKWAAMHAQLFAKYTPEMLENERFHTGLYLAIKAAGDAFLELHNLQHSFFNSKVDGKTFTGRLDETRKRAEEAVAKAGQELQQTENLPLTPNGMPQRKAL
ncbi:MAG: DUF4339 domain-containing protein [Bacteriovoracia bacterium]